MSVSLLTQFVPHSSHWGAFSVRLREGQVEVFATPT
jgi:hypothetical protein